MTIDDLKPPRLAAELQAHIELAIECGSLEDPSAAIEGLDSAEPCPAGGDHCE